jgi:membrane protein implicated in regulation of membrane protease activity
MCHIIFAMPFLSLALFWFLPFQEALMWFIGINAVSFFLFYKIYRVMKRRPANGKSALIGREATVIEGGRSGGRIRLGSEIWFARANQALRPGQHCTVVGFRGLEALVVPAADTGGKFGGRVHQTCP